MTKEENYKRLRKDKNYSWCTDDQWECCKMVFDLVCGEHHLYSKIKPYGFGISYNTGNDFSTFDFNTMTIAVFMAHDRCIRLSVHAAYNHMVKLCLWKRKGREGDICKRHPTLDQAITEYRKYYPLDVNEKE